VNFKLYANEGDVEVQSSGTDSSYVIIMFVSSWVLTLSLFDCYKLIM